jgi:hypothetical protein
VNLFDLPVERIARTKLHRCLLSRP